MNIEFRDLIEKLLEIIEKKKGPFSEEIKNSFRKYPRHFFLNKFSLDHKRWSTLNEKTLEEYLPLIYSDISLLLYDEGEFLSTISQPSFVFLMLKLLDLKKGEKVFELGTGSGWNAALMAELVGPKGTVVTTEVAPIVYKQAVKNLKKFSLPQIEVVLQDGTEGYANKAPFDKAIFTAGSYDLPEIFFHQVKDGGRILFVLKSHLHNDLLLVLEKVDGHFESSQSIPCLFVPLVSNHKLYGNEALDEIVRKGGKVKIYPKCSIPEENKKMISTDSSIYIYENLPLD